MLRIGVVSHTPEEVVLKVEGWIAGESVILLEEEGRRWLERTERLVLDLTGVRFIDRRGRALLKRWSEERCELRGGSPFVRAQLTSWGLE